MRKILSSIMLVAVAAMASVSCQKEEAQAPVEPKSTTLTLHANVEETKTYIEDNTVLWGTGEYVQLYFNDGEKAQFVKSNDTNASEWAGSDQAMFAFDIEYTQADSYVLGGVYPASVTDGISNSDAANFKLALPSVQNATTSSYDPAAFIMIMKPETIADADFDKDGHIASFRRAVALNKVTLTGVKENVSSVEITLPEGKYLAGRRYFDLTTGVEGAVYESQTNTIKVNADYTGSSIDVWFTSWGVELAEGDKVTIRMTSDSKLYTRTISVNSNGLKFVEGSLNKLSVNMETAEEEDLDNLAGEYLIAAMPGEWMLMSGVNELSYYSRLESGVTSTALDVLCSDFYKVEDIETCVWTVAKVDGGYSLQNNATRKYLTLTANDNKAHTSDVAVALDITITDKVAKVVHEQYTNRELEYNSSSPRFAFYQNTQKDIYFIPWVEDSTPRISVSSNSIEVAADATSCEFTYKLRNAEGTPAVAVADGATMTDVDATASDGTVTVTFAANTEEVEKTATLVLSFDGATDVEVVITQAAKLAAGASAPEGSVLWSENWGTYTGTVANYTFVGTTVYDENVSALTYEVDNNNDKIESTTAGSVTSNNLFFYKSAASSWTIKGVKLHGASSVTLKYTINRTNIAVYYSVDGSSEKQLCSSSSSGVNTKQITDVSGETITFRFNKTGTSNNCRIDDISLTVN